jgi:hypothetical protein
MLSAGAAYVDESAKAMAATPANSKAAMLNITMVLNDFNFELPDNIWFTPYLPGGAGATIANTKARYEDHLHLAKIQDTEHHFVSLTCMVCLSEGIGGSESAERGGVNLLH